MKEIVPQSKLVQERQQGLALISPLKHSVFAIIVESAEEYAIADALLARIRQAESSWLSRINPIIEPIRSSLDLLYGLRKDIVDPIHELEGVIKDKMRAFKVKEAQLLKEANDKRQKELAELQRQADEKAKREANAKTNAMRSKLAEARGELEQKLANAKAQVAPTPIKVSGSSSRKVKKWKVTDFTGFILYVASIEKQEEAEEMMSLLCIDEVQMNAFFKLTKPDAGEWLPGITVTEEITIAGR